MRAIGLLLLGGGFAAVIYEVFLVASNPFVCVVALIAMAFGGLVVVDGGAVSGG